MGMFGKLAKAGMAKKVMNQAKKPENQRKIKSMVSNFTNKNKGSGGSGRPRRAR